MGTELIYMQTDDPPVLITFFSLLKHQWLYYLVYNFFYKQYFLDRKSLSKIHAKIWHPKLLQAIHENFKALFSVKCNTNRNGNV